MTVGLTSVVSPRHREVSPAAGEAQSSGEQQHLRGGNPITGRLRVGFVGFFWY